MARLWYKRRGGDILMATLSFPSSDHRWAYSAMLDMLNERDRPIADDAGFICGFTGLSKRRWAQVRQWLLEGGYLEIDHEGHLTNRVFERERLERLGLSEELADAGHRGGKKSAQMRAAGQTELPLGESDPAANDHSHLGQAHPRDLSARPRAHASAHSRTDAPPKSKLSSENPKINAGLSEDKLPLGASGSNGSNDLGQANPPTSRAREEKNRLESTHLDSSHNNIVENDAPGRDGAGGDNLLGNADLLTLYEAVCDAAGYHPMSPGRMAGAQTLIKEWRDRGLDFDLVVIPTIRAVMAKSTEPTRTLHRFRDRIDHEAARLKARPANGKAPSRSPVLAPEGEDPMFQPIRAGLLESIGADAYCIAFNDVRFADQGRCQGDKRPLKVEGPDYLTEKLRHGLYSKALRSAVRPLGFTDVW